MTESVSGVDRFRTREMTRPHAVVGPLLPAGTLEFGGESLSREACWAELGPRTRERVLELGGTSLEWWAVRRELGGRPAVLAGLLGQAGFVVAEPRLNAERRVVMAIHAYLFTPGSSRFVPVSWKPASLASRSCFAQAARVGPPRVRAVGLGFQDAKTIGSMPPKAQELLLEPFVRGERLLRCETYYWGGPAEAKIFAVVLAGECTVTSAVGDRFVPVGHDETTAHWNLVCRRARVARRIGR